MPVSHVFWRSPQATLVASLLLVVLAQGCGTAARADDRAQQPPPDLDVRIAELIDQLGADQFATREKAQFELERLGLSAFDALHEAQTHDDIEIALRARHLVRSMNVNWAHDDDPVEVKRILRDYGSQNETQRRNLMDRLAALDDGDGLVALCRLVRFETSSELSKHAALMIMHYDAPDDPAILAAWAQTLRGAAGLSKRTAAQWIRAYALTLEDPQASLVQWDQLARRERANFTQFPDQSSTEIVRDLLRWQASLLRRLGHETEAVAVIRQTIDLLDGNDRQLFDTVDWLIQQKTFVVIDDMARKFPDAFESDAKLLYMLAESHRLRENRQQAEQTSLRASKLLTEKPDSHILTGIWLEERGLIDWSEREYRLVMQWGPIGSLSDIFARFRLSEMLHDNLQELAAAEVLQAVVDAMDKDPKVLQTIKEKMPRDPGGVRSRMHYFYAQHFASLGNEEKKFQHLEQGVKNDPHDADVLIAMYRATGTDDRWREKTLARIDAAVGHFRDKIKSIRSSIERARIPQLQENYMTLLATENNQLAWLVGNTVGDYDEAIRCSHRSLELTPERGGFYDTLGRCYYAKGDYASAVKYQTRAVELEPHSGQIKRQLELFRKALAESQAEPAAATD